MSGPRDIAAPLLGTGAWIAGTLVGIALPPWSCGAGARPEPWVMALLLIAALGGIALAWAGMAAPLAPRRFLAAITAGLSAVLALALALQLLAALVLGPCGT